MYERNMNRLPLTRTPTGDQAATQACALTGNPTGDLLCGTMPNPLSHVSQGLERPMSMETWDFIMYV